MKLHHPKSGQQIDVSADRAAIYESQGWVRTPAKKPATSGTDEVKEQGNGSNSK